MDNNEWLSFPIGNGINLAAMIPEEHRQLYARIKETVHKRLHLAPEEVKKREDDARKNGVQAVFPMSIRMGTGPVLDAKFSSSFPSHLLTLKVIHICDFCMHFADSEDSLKRHLNRCTTRFPPGDLLYKRDKFAVFEVDGRKARTYCQNVCMVSKLFVENKAVILDTDFFFFYVLCEIIDQRCHFIGYFSKEKYDPINHNLMTLMVLPGYKGCGRLLISMSYAITQQQKMYVGPEGPLSEEGEIAFRSYWKLEIFKYLNLQAESEDGVKPTVKGIMEATGIAEETILQFCVEQKWISKREEKKKGEATVKPAYEHIKRFLEEESKKNQKKGRIIFVKRLFNWTPKNLTLKDDGYYDPSAEE